MEAFYSVLVEKLLPILQCPTCGNGELEIVERKDDFGLKIPLSDKCLMCKECKDIFPMTEDFIPIMWTPLLRNCINGESESSLSALSANIEVYNETTNNYHDVYIDKHPQKPARLNKAAERIVGGKNTELKYHLDFGCGPGIVITMIKRDDFLQFGIDVSLENLRNARKHGKAIVICGDATRMPFADNSFDIVTESSVLHHIESWNTAVAESCRICKNTGGVILDSEPSIMEKAWGPLAIAVYNARFPVYKLMSYFVKSRFMFRDIKRAKLNELAEIHNIPGGGLSTDEMVDVFKQSGFDVEIIYSPTQNLISKFSPGPKMILLNLLSFRNPWNPKYGNFIAIAKGGDPN